MFENRPLIDYLPPVLRDVREYQALMAGEEPEIALLWQNAQSALDDQFVSSATENGVRRWERILNIVPKATFTLEERKFTILTRLAEQLPYTVTMLKRMLSELCGPNGFTVDLNAGEYTLNVKVALTAVNNFNDVNLLLFRVCPANLIINLLIEFNQHFKLKPFTHGELAQKTHYMIRNEVI